METTLAVIRPFLAVQSELDLQRTHPPPLRAAAAGERQLLAVRTRLHV